jgi:hypothetical protein
VTCERCHKPFAGLSHWRWCRRCWRAITLERQPEQPDQMALWDDRPPDTNVVPLRRAA